MIRFTSASSWNSVSWFGSSPPSGTLVYPGGGSDASGRRAEPADWAGGSFGGGVGL